MSQNPQPDLQSAESRRERLRRGLFRSTAAALGMLALALLLALLAWRYGGRAERSAAAEREAREGQQERLWQSLLAGARSERLSTKPGRRGRSLEAIRAAAAIRRSPELRDELVAALALTDLGEVSYEVLPTAAGEVAHSGDGSQVARYDGAGKIVVGELEIDSGLDGFIAMRFSPGGRWLAARSEAGAVAVFDLQDAGKAVLAETHHRSSYVNTIGFGGPGGALFCFTCQGEGKVFVSDLTHGAGRSRDVAVPAADELAISGDGRSAAVVSDSRRVVFFDLASGETTREAITLPRHPNALAWFPDGARLAAVDGSGEIHIHDLDNDIRQKIVGHDLYISGLTVGPDGRLFATRSWDGKTRLWESASMRAVLTTTTGFADTFSADGSRLHYSREHSGRGVWSMDRSEVFERFAAPGIDDSGFRGGDISRDAQLVAAVGDTRVFIWRRPDGRLLCAEKLDQNLTAVRFSDDATKLLICGDEGIARYPLMPGADGETLALGKVARLRRGSYGAATPVPGQKFCLMGRRDAVLIDTAELEIQSTISGLRGADPGNGQMLLMPDGESGVTTGWKESGTELWSAEKGAIIRRLEENGGAATLSPSGDLLVTHSPQRYTFWNTADWTRRAVFEGPFSTAATSAAVCYDDRGALVAVAGEPGTIRLHDGRTAEQLCVLEIVGDDIPRSMRFSAGGSELVAATNEGNVLLWKLDALRAQLDAEGLGIGTNLEDKIISNNPLPPTTRPIAMWFAPLALLGALVFGGATLLYQRRLIASYSAAEDEAHEQSEKVARAQKELLASQKMEALGTLSAGIAHDFKNLLSVVRLSNSFIRRDAAGHEDIIDETIAIENAVERGDKVVKSMLGYSRAQRDESPTCDGAEAVEEMLGMLGQQFLRGVVLEVQIAPDLPPVAAPRGALEQILLNLVFNAAEAMAGKGKLTVRYGAGGSSQTYKTVTGPAADAGDCASVDIADDGPGMPEDVAARVFEPFFTTKDMGVSPGIGLGLSTVYTLCERFGLGLSLSTAPGAGTAFRILIPFARKETESP